MQLIGINHLSALIYNILYLVLKFWLLTKEKSALLCKILPRYQVNTYGLPSVLTDI